MPKDSVILKYLKRTAVVLILSLAVAGVFSVLRKAPKLHIPEEDKGYIEEIFGGSKFKTSGSPSEGGVSGLMDFGVSGAPAVGKSSGTPSNPAVQNDAPVYSNSSSSGASEAPTFIAVPTSSIPAASASQTSVPLFAGQPPASITVQEIPVLKIPAALEAISAPVYGSQYQLPQTQKPVQPPLPVSVPNAPANPAVPSSAVPSGTTLQKTTFIPVSPPDLYVPPPSFDGPAEIIQAETITPAVSAVQSSPVSEPQRNFSALEPQSFSSTDVSPVAAAVVTEPQNTEQQVVFIPPPFKHLPQVAEEYYQPPIKNAAENTVQNTENSAAMVLTPLRSPLPDEVAKVSFSPQIDKPVKSSVSNDVQKNTEPAKTLIVSEPVLIETETIPFTAVPAAAEKTAEKTSAGEQLVQQVSAAVSSPSNELNKNILRFIDSQCREADSGNPEQLRNAFIQLSRLYNRKELSEYERNHLVPILSRIGVDVIFSRNRHILEPAYIVKENDTADSVAAAFQISPELLMKINGLTGARPLRPGTPLKVVHGQFDARVLPSKGQFVLILGGLYAGQFPVSTGKEIQNIRGDFYVAEKTDSYRGKTLTLNNGILLRSGEQNGKTLCFAEKDADELFDILTDNSVIIFE